MPLFKLTHQATALAVALFGVLRLLSAAKHMLIDRDGLLLRMWSSRTSCNDHSHPDHPLETR